MCVCVLLYQGHNPLYKGATSTFTNITFRGKDWRSCRRGWSRADPGPIQGWSRALCSPLWGATKSRADLYCQPISNICKYVGIIVRVCVVRTLLLNEIQICMSDDTVEPCRLSTSTPELRPGGFLMSGTICMQNKSVLHLFSDSFQFFKFEVQYFIIKCLRFPSLN